MALPLTKFQLLLVFLLIIIWVTFFATTIWSPTAMEVSDAGLKDEVAMIKESDDTGFNSVTVNVVAEETSAEIVVSTVDASLAIGEQTEVVVSISNPDEDMISAYQAFVTFDPEMVEVVSIANGAVYEQDASWQNLFAVSNDTQVRLAGVTLGEGSDDQLIEIARFTVRAVDSGEAIFLVEADQASGRGNELILNEQVIKLGTGNYTEVVIE